MPSISSKSFNLLFSLLSLGDFQSSSSEPPRCTQTRGAIATTTAAAFDLDSVTTTNPRRQYSLRTTLEVCWRVTRTCLNTMEACESGSASTPTKEDLIAKELSLTGLGLSSVPPTVWESDEIVKVDLSRNSIQRLPNELSSCGSLGHIGILGLSSFCFILEI